MARTMCFPDERSDSVSVQRHSESLGGWASSDVPHGESSNLIDFIHPIFPSGKAPECGDKFEAPGRGMYETEGVHEKANE